MDNHTPSLAGGHSACLESLPESLPEHLESLHLILSELSSSVASMAVQRAAPVSKTGVKLDSAPPPSPWFSIDLDSIRDLNPAHVDWLTFTIPGYCFDWDIRVAGRYLDKWTGGLFSIGGKLRARYNGYAECWQFVESEGGESPNLGYVGVSSASDHMRGRWCFNLPGTACAFVENWAALYEDLREMGGRITRCDVALDDLAGRHPIKEAKHAYDTGAFNGNGRRPSGNWIQDLQEKRGNTLNIGNRISGKLARVYEKGKQLGDENSSWVRYEGELRHGNGRIVPLDILLMPGQYLKGMYPRAFSWMPVGAIQLHAMREKARISLERAEIYARRQVGRLVCFMREVLNLDDDEIVARLSAEPGRYPLRLWEPGRDAALPWDGPGAVSAEPAF